METLYRARNWFASGPSILVLLALIVMTAMHTTKPPKKAPDQTPMKISIAAPPETPPPTSLPEMTPLQEVTADVALQPLQKFTPKTTPKPTPSPTAAPTPAPQEQPAVASAPPVATAPASRAPAAPSSASADDAYSTKLRAYLESVKHYPTSKEARLQRPHGVVNIWVVIDRSGGMKEAGVEDSSGSLILDGAALSTVRGASYPPIPADAFPGQSTHRFTVQLNYQAA